MAFMLGVRLVSYGLAGAAVIITYESTKARKEKLYRWVADKFKRRSPDSTSPSPNAGVDAVNTLDVAVKGETFPCDAEQVTSEATVLPTVDSTDFQSDAELSHVAGDLVTEVNAVSLQGARELPSQADDVNAVNSDQAAESAKLNQVAGHLVPAVNAVTFQGARELSSQADDGNAVNGDQADESAKQSHAASDQLDAVQGDPRSDPLRQDADVLRREAPDPAPSRGICGYAKAVVDAVRDWKRELFQWVAGKFKHRASDRGSEGINVGKLVDGVGPPGLTEWTVDPGIRNKILRISTRILWLAVDSVVLWAFKRNTVLIRLYSILKSELK